MSRATRLLLINAGLVTLGILVAAAWVYTSGGVEVLAR